MKTTSYAFTLTLLVAMAVYFDPYSRWNRKPEKPCQCKVVEATNGPNKVTIDVKSGGHEIVASNAVSVWSTNNFPDVPASNKVDMSWQLEGPNLFQVQAAMDAIPKLEVKHPQWLIDLHERTASQGDAEAYVIMESCVKFGRYEWKEATARARKFWTWIGNKPYFTPTNLIVRGDIVITNYILRGAISNSTP